MGENKSDLRREDFLKDLQMTPGRFLPAKGGGSVEPLLDQRISEVLVEQNLKDCPGDTICVLGIRIKGGIAADLG